MSRPLSQAQACALAALGKGPLLKYLNGRSWGSATAETQRFPDPTLTALWDFDLLHYRGERVKGPATARLTDRGALVLKLIEAGEPYRLVRTNKDG